MSDSQTIHAGVTYKSRNFERKLSRFLRDKDETDRKAGRRIFFDLLRRVIMKTPVDTGRARAGFGAGAEASGASPSYDTEPKREGRALSTFHESKAGTRLRLKCVNAVVYAEMLEHGHSGQAPFGMVRVSIAEIEEELGLSGGLPELVRSTYQEAWEAAGMPIGQELRAGELVDILPGLFSEAQREAASERRGEGG